MVKITPPDGGANAANQTKEQEDAKRNVVAGTGLTADSDNDEDPWITRIKRSGCFDEHEKLQDCYFESRDWRECRKEMDQFKECFQKQLAQKAKDTKAQPVSISLSPPFVSSETPSHQSPPSPPASSDNSKGRQGSWWFFGRRQD